MPALRDGTGRVIGAQDSMEFLNAADYLALRKSSRPKRPAPAVAADELTFDAPTMAELVPGWARL